MIGLSLSLMTGGLIVVRATSELLTRENNALSLNCFMSLRLARFGGALSLELDTFDTGSYFRGSQPGALFQARGEEFKNSGGHFVRPLSG